MHHLNASSKPTSSLGKDIVNVTCCCEGAWQTFPEKLKEISEEKVCMPASEK